MSLYCKEKLNTDTRKRFFISYFHKKTPATYRDKTCQSRQCYPNANRSVLDLKELLNTYFKKQSSTEDVVCLLVELVRENKIKSLYCTDISKVVFFNKAKGYFYFGGEGLYIAPNNYRVGIDGFSFLDMEEIYNSRQK